MIDFSCPRCGSTQREADSAAGQKVPYSKCGQRLKVPDPLEMRTIQAVLVLPKGAAGPSQNAVSSKKSWYYQEGDQRGGPVTWTDLQRMASEGELSLEQLVWGEGMPSWTSAQSAPDLFPPPSKRAAEKKSSGLVGVAVVFLCGTVGLSVLGVGGFLAWREFQRSESSKATEVAAATPKTEPERSTAPKTEPDRSPEPKEIFDRCSPSVVRVLHSRGALDDDVRKRLKDLRNLHSDLKTHLESPRGTAKEYVDKVSQFDAQLERLFKDLCRDLELKDEERLSVEEWKKFVGLR